MHCGWTVSLIVLREGGTEPGAGDEQKGICFLYSLKVVCMGCTCYRRCVHHGIPVERTAFRGWFSSSTVEILRIELGLSGLVSGAFTY